MHKTSTDFSNACQVRRFALELECTCKFVQNFLHVKCNCFHINKVNTSSVNLIRGIGACAESILWLNLGKFMVKTTLEISSARRGGVLQNIISGGRVAARFPRSSIAACAATATRPCRPTARAGLGPHNKRHTRSAKIALWSRVRIALLST